MRPAYSIYSLMCSRHARKAVVTKRTSYRVAVLAIALCAISGVSFAAELQAIHTAIQERTAKWIAGETSISRLSPAERLSRVGLIKPQLSGQEKPLAAAPDQPVAVPSSFDWRN